MSKRRISLLTILRFIPVTDYEDYLEKMALQGWVPDRLHWWNGYVMTFKKATPQRYRYVFDFNPLAKKDYRPTFEEFGWTYMGQLSSCHAWRKAYSTERPESFSDLASLRHRNRGARNVVLSSFLLVIALLVTMLTLLVKNYATLSSGWIVFLIIASVFFGSSLIFGFWIVWKLQQNIDR